MPRRAKNLLFVPLVMLAAGLLSQAEVAADAVTAGVAWAGSAEVHRYISGIEAGCAADSKDARCVERQVAATLDAVCGEAPGGAECLAVRRELAARKQFVRQLCAAYPAMAGC